MKLPWQKEAETTPEQPTQPPVEQDNAPLKKAYTPKKGKATPKRKEAQQHPGTFEARYAPADSYGESRKRRKALKESMTAEEWKEYKAKEREERRKRQRDAQAAMDRGEERYLLPRDKGEERRYVRDIVDSKRYLSNYVMPFFILLLILMLIGQRFPNFGAAVSLVTMALMVVFMVEGIFLGRKVNRQVREKFPHTTATGIPLGFYAYSRATQPRRWRTPRPRVELGQEV